MPIIIGIILGLACLVSGVGFWSNLPNGDLGIIFAVEKNEAMIRLAIDSGQANLLLLFLWGTVLLLTTTALFEIMGSIINKEDGANSAGFFLVFVLILILLVFAFVFVFDNGNSEVARIGSDFVVWVRSFVKLIGGLLVIGGIGIYLFGVILLVWFVIDGVIIDNYKSSNNNHQNDFIKVLISALSTILIVGIIWLLLRPISAPPLTPREATLVAIEQSNQTLIAELTNNANATATESIYQGTESALKTTQTAVFMMVQGTMTIPTQQPSNTPQIAPTPDINVTLTANAQAIASLEMQSTDTPEANLSNPIIGEESSSIVDGLRDPIWGGIGVIVAICGIPLALAGLYFAWKQSQK